LLQRTHGSIKAVDGVELTIGVGESVGLVGESGSGKSTLARVALRLVEPTNGEIAFDDVELTKLSDRDLRRRRRDMQMVFQDPYASMDPRPTVGSSVAEPLRAQTSLHGAQLDTRVSELFEMVGLPGAWRHRYPHEFSGGQLQRIAVSRALATNPRFIVLDE